MATQLGCSLTDLPSRVPSWERPYWQAWWQIEPSGWEAQNLNTARIERALSFWVGKQDIQLDKFIIPPATMGAFDEEARQVESVEREIAQAKSILGA